MKRVAVFTEGQSEQIFVRNMLMKLINNAHLSFECLSLRAGNLLPARFNFLSASAKIHFMIIDVGNDTRVTGAIREREHHLFAKGYERIIGLRDMYCDAYDRRSRGQVRAEVSQEIEGGIIREIAEMSEPTKISVFFEIMEFEAWILAMYDLFGRVDARLSVDYICGSVHLDLRSCDPETEFYRPSTTLKKVFAIIGMNYKKSASDIEMICAVMTTADFESAIERGRCDAFKKFYSEIRTYVVES
jgi:hypothetical protein